MTGTAQDTGTSSGNKDPFDVPKKYRVELLDGGTIRVYLDEEFPNVQTMKNQPGGRYAWPLNSRECFFSQIVIPNDVEEQLPEGKGVRVTGYIDLEPIDRQ